MLQKLLKAINESPLSVPSIAKLSGVKIRTIENWLYTECKPTLDNAEKVFNALGYTITIEEQK